MRGNLIAVQRGRGENGRCDGRVLDHQLGPFAAAVEVAKLGRHNGRRSGAHFGVRLATEPQAVS
jgi:hypothetical protein